MTKSEMLELVKLAKTGDTKATTKLYLQCENLIRDYCRKYKNLTTLEQEDLVQYCAVYFIDAIEKFDISRDLKFTTFLFTRLQMIYRDVIYNDVTIRRPANYMTILKEDESQIISTVSIDAKIPGNNHGDTFTDLQIDPSDTPDTAMIKHESHDKLANAVAHILGKYNEEEILHLLHHYDLYEIMGYPVLDDYPLPKSHRDRIRKSFMKHLRATMLNSAG